MALRFHPRKPPPSQSEESRGDPFNVTLASRIFFLPNLMTAGNLFCGFMAVVQCIQARLAETSPDGLYLDVSPAGHYRYAVYFIFGAALFDSLDGRLARLGGRESLFGAEFDSLADVISFGMAPALMMFYFILSPTQGIPWFRHAGWMIGFVYLLCAAMRLARFNVITNPLLTRSQKESTKDFVGLPVPAAAGTVAATLLFLLKLQEADRSLNRFALTLPFLMLLIAFLMMSTIRYPSGKHLDLQTRTKVRTFIGLAIVVITALYFMDYGLLTLALGDVSYGLIRHLRRSKAATSRPTAPANPL